MRISHLLSFLLIQSAITLSFAQEAAKNPGARTWSHSDGRKVKAGLISANADSVTLRLPNGTTGEVKLSKLNQDDRDYVAGWLKKNAQPKDFGQADRVIEITTLKGEMKYNKPTFSVYPGKKIKLILRNADDMHHNLVITKPGKGNDMKVAQEAWKLGADGFAKSWIPKHPDLLFASKMGSSQSAASSSMLRPVQRANLRQRVRNPSPRRRKVPCTALKHHIGVLSIAQMGASPTMPLLRQRRTMCSCNNVILGTPLSGSRRPRCFSKRRKVASSGVSPPMSSPQAARQEVSRFKRRTIARRLVSPSRLARMSAASKTPAGHAFRPRRPAPARFSNSHAGNRSSP